MIKAKEASLNKLVRDKIPEILEAEGAKAETYTVADKAIFREVLLSKLEEEALEASESEDSGLLEELADIETVIDELLKINGWNREDLLRQQAKKDQEMGAYTKKLIIKLIRKEI